MKRICLSLLLPLVMAGCNNAAVPVGADSITLASLSASQREGFLADAAEMFTAAAIVEGPTLVECTLSGGARTVCFSITVAPNPSDFAQGPWCPRNGSDDKSMSGIWLDDGKVHDADGAFMNNLSRFYDDENWQMVDPETGAIKVTDTKEKCAAAARPDVDPEYANYCVECLSAYMPDDASMTYIIPVRPVAATRSGQTSRVGSGVAFNGVKLDGPAPVDAILGAYTIAPFDDCGGHVNLHAGYHYHAVTDCLTDGATASPTSPHAAIIGIAMDGYKIFSHLTSEGQVPNDLDSCQGHSTPEEGYHYHAGAAGSNKIIGCLSAQNGCSSEDPMRRCDASADREPPR